jgi:photosystem II stability/assembly factor-like uncharacterized protein
MNGKGGGVLNATSGNNGAEAFVIDPKNTATVYVGSDKRGVFKTADCGATWVRIDTGTSSDQLASGAQWTMAIDTDFPDTVYANSGYGANGMWQSKNGGVDWNQIFPKEIADFVPYGGFIERIRTDPTSAGHVLVTFHSGCAAPWAPDCAAESTDAGATWKLLHWQPGNQEDAGQFLIDAKTWIFSSLTGPIWRTTDAGATWNKAYQGGASDSLYISKTGALYQGGSAGVLKSDDKGATWTVIPNSPVARDIVGDGTSLFTSNKTCDAAPNCQPYWTAPESDPTTWTKYPAPEGLTRGGWMLRYDNDHHLLYSSNESGGFWRLQTQ